MIQATKVISINGNILYIKNKQLNIHFYPNYAIIHILQQNDNAHADYNNFP